MSTTPKVMVAIRMDPELHERFMKLIVDPVTGKPPKASVVSVIEMLLWDWVRKQKGRAS